MGDTRPILCLVTVLCLFASSLPAQDAKLQRIQDPGPRRDEYLVHDVKEVTFEPTEEAILVRVHFAMPFPEMMFEAVNLNIDCDKDPSTGIGGAELYLRASVGSRFRPNSWRPERADRPAPLETRKLGYATLRRYSAGAGAEEKLNWVWQGNLPPPTAEGKVMTFAVPLQLLRDNSQRYNQEVNLSLRAEGTCSENPIPLRHQVMDEGIDILVDGDDSDWSGGTREVDETGELHPRARLLGLERIQVEHGKDKLFVGIWLEEPGFGTPWDPDADVMDQDRITVAVEPLGGEYQGFSEYVFWSRNPRLVGADRAAVAGKSFLEVSVARAPAQNAFRVIVWSDAIRVDRIPDEGTFLLDTRAGR